MKFFFGNKISVALYMRRVGEAGYYVRSPAKSNSQTEKYNN